MKYILPFLVFLLLTCETFSQSVNDLLNVLIEQKIISQSTADSLRADYSIKQQTTLPDKRLRVDAEFRPRTEYRNGYQSLRNDTSTGVFFINQRLRLSANYVYDNRFAMQFSIQDIRIWGQYDPKSASATLQLFEGWFEPYINNKFSIRIGRQRLIYDNERLFSENDWRLSGAAHDAVNFRFYNSKLSSELALAYNQSAERNFGPDLATSAFTNYKFLAVNYLRYKISKNFMLTALNSSDGYQDKSKPEKINFRYTVGGRVEYESGRLYSTINGYFQGGKNSSGGDLSAWYLQPEIRFKSSVGFVARTGAEILSGNNNSIDDNTDHSFVPLYGSAHRFNGSMDLIARFPADVGGAGLVNQYLFLIQTFFTKLEVRADFHTFHLQQDYYIDDDIKIDRYLGFENDFLMTYRPNAVIKVDLGVAYMLPTESFEIVKNSGNSEYNLYWMVIRLTFKPQLLNLTFK